MMQQNREKRKVDCLEVVFFLMTKTKRGADDAETKSDAKQMEKTQQEQAMKSSNGCLPTRRTWIKYLNPKKLKIRPQAHHDLVDYAQILPP